MCKAKQTIHLKEVIAMCYIEVHQTKCKLGTTNLCSNITLKDYNGDGNIKFLKMDHNFLVQILNL
jgi:DUF4097 and DUF4098 domain-containing protein YvlB